MSTEKWEEAEPNGRAERWPNRFPALFFCQHVSVLNRNPFRRNPALPANRSKYFTPPLDFY